ncbi:hypothetical protein P7K49_036615 [Saguinus oedipus]|uniref:Uncharacterized protein n=1 Tax=Saguinus oedipus TaxID=9490 RepID=A0ABQ9TLB3_SAGOE|nr:hypothetical protein P7K49_036615 [Saguinus oedipus]
MGAAGWAPGRLGEPHCSPPSGDLDTHKRVVRANALRTARDATMVRSPSEGGYREEQASRPTLKRKKGLEVAQMRSPGGTRRRPTTARTLYCRSGTETGDEEVAMCF